MKTFFISLLSLFLFLQSTAQTAGSYIYLEGIRTIPFKLKVNNKEIPVRNKQYYLVPIDQSGEYIMDIIFAGDLYPPQRFILDANNNSAFGYKLAKTVEDKFYLVDLVNKGRIIETNSEVNIGLSTLENTINFSNTLVIKEPTDLVKESKKKKKEIVESNIEPKVEETPKKKKEKKQAELVVKEEKPKKKEPVYGVIEEIKSKPKKEKKEVPVEVEKKKEVVETRKLKTNNCTNAASNQEVSSFVDRLKMKSKDEDRMLVLKKKIFTGCVTCAQLRSITESFNSQFDRLAAVKFLRNSLSDIEHLNQLDDLFKNESGKTKLHNLMYE